MAQHVILPDGNAGRADYNQLRRAAVLLILPATLLLSQSSYFWPLGMVAPSSAPFLKGGIHKRVAGPPTREGEENVPKLLRTRCYAPARPKMPKKDERSANWLEAATLPATG